MPHLPHLIEFVAFTHEFQRIQRSIFAQGEERHENDAEHSFQLALTGWYLIESDNLPLNRIRIVELALTHDLVEVYAGDSPVFQEKTGSKDEDEKEAVQQLKKQFPGFTSLEPLLNEYKERATEESKFVYALDKLLPIINNYLDGGRSWKMDKVSIGRVIQEKTAKVGISPAVNEYYPALIELLQTKPELFGAHD
ncbi:MAG TPA: HD domain-containing protein [Verrucomicrobiae bacterium]|nr:HD domain-containing protein [Verrucomicrobiae bacterium]